MLYLFLASTTLFPLATNAEDLTSLRTSGREAYEAKNYALCGKLFSRAAVLPDESFFTVDEYSASHCFALSGDEKKALAHLRRAVDGGFSEVERLRSDPLFVSLHKNRVEWQTILRKAETNVRRHSAKIDPELARIFQEDQDAQRRASPEDGNAARLARVKQIVAEHRLRVADDFYHAAMVFQHGKEPTDYEQAHRLALRAVELDPRNAGHAKWLAAAAKDRWLQSLGQPQLYGTQIRKNGSQWTVEPVDRTVTDQERARWNVPPLKDAESRAQKANEVGEPT